MRPIEYSQSDSHIELPLFLPTQLIEKDENKANVQVMENLQREHCKPTKQRMGSVRKGRSNISLISLVLLLSISMFIPSMAGYESGIPKLEASGAGGNGCTCHGFQTDKVEISLEVVGNISEILPGETYTLEIGAVGGPDEEGTAYGGFLLNVDAGDFVANDEVEINSAGDEASHSLEGNDQRVWRINWVAGTNDLTEFTLRVNSVNGDGVFSDLDDWNMAIYYLKDDGTFTQTLVEPEARFIAPEWTQDLILVLSGLLMFILSVIALNPKYKGRRKKFD